MAEFTRKRTKGAVGRLIKGEALAKDRPAMDYSLLSSALPDSIEALTEEIKSSHKAALGQMGRAVIAAARAGQLLIAAKDKLPKEKNFTVWLAETFEFSQRTAYNYMKVSEKMASKAAELEHCESIRDVLKLCDDNDPAKKKKDEKRESVVTHLAKVERWITEQTSKIPLEDWEPQRREELKKLFAGVARFHAEL